MANLLGRFEELVKREWSKYIAKLRVSVTITPENATAHKTNISDSRELTRELQKLVHEHRLQRQRTVRKDVAVFLHSNEYLDYHLECSVSVLSTL